MAKPKYIYILGPTGVGKTDLSLQLAQSLQLPIINCDSLQVYKHLDIGTAKPSKEEMNLAKHYCFDYVEPPKTLTASDYIKNVVQTIEEKKIKDLVFVGGSGFYIQALEKGMFPNSETPQRIKDEINKWIEDKGMADLYSWLKERDPDHAHFLSENDHYRIQRAVEVMKTQNKKMSTLKKEMKDSNYSLLKDHTFIKVGLKMEKTLLRKRIEKRAQKMLDQGFLLEVQSLLDQGFVEWPPMKSVGYKECVEYIEGKLSEDELFERIVISTMQLIKKQMTWFKRDSSIHWFEITEVDEAKSYVSGWYNS